MGLSLQEKERRYSLVRQMMAERNLDALVVSSNAQTECKGYVRFLSDMNIPIFSSIVVFPIAGKPSLFPASPLQQFWSRRLSWMEDATWSGEPAVETARTITDLGFDSGRVGLCGAKTMTAGFVDSLRARLPKAEIVEASQVIDYARIQKSPEEMVWVRDSAKIADLALAAFGEAVRPGATELEVVGEVNSRVMAAGGEAAFYLVSPDNSIPLPYVPTDRKFEGKVANFSVEVAGPNGYWTQAIRMYSLSPLSGESASMYRKLTESLERAAEGLRPGNISSSVAIELEESARRHGFKMHIHPGHAMGLDIVELPRINKAVDVELKAGMTIVVHPHFVSEDETVNIWIGDMYLVEETGATRLTTYDSRL